MLKKFTSRKFLICLAAFLASVSTSIAGIGSQNEVIAAVGLVCGVLSAGIYAAVEAALDAKSMEGETDDKE